MLPFPQLPPGSRVGRLVVEARLGSGGMGVVHAARDEHLGRTVALKVLSPHLAEDPGFRERFRREAAVLGRLDSPHIVQVYDHGEHEGLPWIATQLISGGDLGALIARRGPLPPLMAARLCAQVAAALDVAHAAGILHRDVKPSNVLVNGADTAEPHAYLCDFGIAHTGGQELTMTGGIAGSWGFMAPERGRGEAATVASDVYAAGCLLWNCLTGQPPFPGTDMEMAIAHAREPIPQLPGSDATTQQLNAVLSRAMAKDPGQRHASAAELADELDALASGRGLARPLGPAGTSPRPGPRRPGRGVVAALVVGLVALVAIATVVFVTWPDGPAPGPDPDPTASGSSDPDPEPVDPVDRPITSDFDGDGLGDVAMNEWSNAKLPTRVLSSTGEAFSEPKSFVTGARLLVSGDFDGDEATDVVAVAGGQGSGYTLTVVYGGTDKDQEFTLKAPAGSDSVNPTVGDFDGDGNADVALTSNLTLERGQEIWVSRSTGDGFAEFESWYRSNSDPRKLVPGDFDGDGSDDLVLPRDSGFELLASDGSGFTSEGEQPLTQQVLNPSAGDFDGNGTDELVSLGGDQDLLSVWSWDDDAWEDTAWLQVEGPDLDLRLGLRPSVGDYDGDRRDDVMLLAGDYEKPPMPLYVARSTGTAFEQPRSWLDYDCECVQYFETVGPLRE